MNSFLSDLIGRLNLAVGILVLVVSTLLIGMLAPVALAPPAAYLLGAVLGLLLAFVLCGIIAQLAVVIERLDGRKQTASIEMAQRAAASAPTPAAGSHTGVNGAATPQAMADTASANGAHGPAGGEVADASLEKLLSLGRFADFHVRKAELAIQQRDFKAALYQLSAALSHEPRHSAARQLRAEIKQAGG